MVFIPAVVLGRWRPPANVAKYGKCTIDYYFERITRRFEQMFAGKSINVIVFPDIGTLVWGART
jgi:hypothetical protein